MANTKDMTLEEALDDILDVEPPLKKAAVACIRANREKAIPQLLQRVEDILNDGKSGVVDEFIDSHWYPIYLLAEFRERRAFPLLLRCLELNQETEGAIFGDCIDDDIPRALASCGTAEDMPRIREIALSTKLDAIHRIAAMEVPPIWYAEGMLNRESVTVFLRDLMTASAHEAEQDVVSFASHYAMELGLTELHPLVKQLYSEEIIDETLSGDWNETLSYYGNPTRAFRKYKEAYYHKPVTDALEVFSRWHIYREPEEATAPRAAKRDKVGQNDPCPCGSGKKYKKCCFLYE